MLKQGHNILLTVPYYFLLLFLLTCAKTEKKKVAAGQKFLIFRASLHICIQTFM